MNDNRPSQSKSEKRRWPPWRWGPSSLAGQTVVVLLIGLTVSHLMSLGLYSFDRARLLEMLGGRALVTRVVEATRLIEAAGSPRAERRLERVFRDGRLRLRVMESPLIPANAPAPEGRMAFRAHVLERALAGAFAEGDAGPRAVRIGVVPPDGLSPPEAPAVAPGQAGRPPRPWLDFERRGFPPWRSGAGDGEPRDADGPFRHYLHRWVVGDPDEEAMGLAVALEDGRWLNAVAFVPRPRGFWTPGALASIGLMAAVTLALSVWAVRRMTRPLRAVADAARRMGVDPRHDPLPEAGSRELREVARAFNEMQARLARLIDNRTRLLAAISHDLRTPITSLRLRAEFIENAEERTRMLATLEEMEAMVRATLDFAREDATAEAVRAVDLTALVSAVCVDLAETGEPVRFDEDVDEGQGVVARGRPVALRRAVVNLARNACLYGGGAEVALEPASVLNGPGHAIIVRDEGPGIPEEHLPRVTDPFHRVESSRARHTGGIGLGLSIVQAVADAHGGRLLLRNRPTGGLEARLEIPTGPL
ncbi:ATP-binding protein [Rhodospira trueperi]|uniref:histidine kinase n=1 Tax=Rhodospira trueperi TaxID=69960 RepID=A0A1G7BI77_9PROT|nr:ATP-binding protein [Rhodospira trueperi]SDE26587.1 Signal transduction histidine kinase [Rhodospira trueperi]